MIGRSIVFAGVAVALGACANPPKPLYVWEGFPRQQYDTLTHSASPADQILAMQATAEKARASGSALPPGFRAHLAMLQFNAGNTDAARSLWLEEEMAFPESTPYIDQLLKRLDGRPPQPEQQATATEKTS